MKRKIIKIDENACSGCGLCASACNEGAIQMIDGKAKLVREDYCDGLGNCLPACPTGAITFEEREAPAYDEAAVLRAKAAETAARPAAQPAAAHTGCPGMRARTLAANEPAAAKTEAAPSAVPSRLGQWPCQIKLIAPSAAYLNGAHLLIAADCAAYAYGNFHADFMKNKITVIGCPKLDEADYSEKLTAILTENDIRSVTVVRMEVPCCAGIAQAAVTALKNCGKMIPWSVVTIGIDGNIIESN